MRMLFVVAAAALVSSAAAAKPMSLEQRENAVWQSVKAQQIDAFAANLAPNFIGVYNDGFYDKARQVAFVRGQNVRSFRISNFSSRAIGGGDVLLTYRLDVRGNKGKDNFSGGYWATSLWHRSGRNWTMVYHSDVKAK